MDFRDTSLTSGFVPNIPVEDPDSHSQSSGSFNHSSGVTMKFVRRLADIVQRKTQLFLRPSSNSLSKITCTKQLAPISAMMGHDVFEPVTGFVFKWDKAEPPVKISEFEKEMSVYWKPNNDPSDKQLNDKHLNSLNILYNIERNNKYENDLQNVNETFDVNEHGDDSNL